MKITRRRIIILVLIPIIGVAAFFAVRSFVFSKIESAIEAKLQEVESQGLKVHYQALALNWSANTIQIDQLLLEPLLADTACVNPEFISMDRIQASGFRLMPIIFRKILSFDDLRVDGLKMVMRENSQLYTNSTSENPEDFSLNIDRIFIGSADITYTDSIHCKKISGIKSDLAIDGLAIAMKAGDSLQYDINSVSFSTTEIALPEALYTFRIKRTLADFAAQKLRIDSIEVIPDLEKVAFGRKKGFETDRYDAIIPFFELSNLSFSLRDSLQLAAGMGEIQFYLKVFRDKRQPFVKKNKLLPIEQLRALPFALKMDSLKIRKSYVRYEEFAVEATEPGNVYFDNLYASFYNVDNKSDTGSMKLSAKSNLVGHGMIDLFVNFPLETGKRSYLSGSIVDFSLPEINTMLTPSTNLRIESGNMEKMTFQFSFDNIRSDGEIDLNYENLKLAVFKNDTDRDKEAQKDNFKTFMMNTFIFRTDMDEDVPEEKRTGTVSYVRDNHRSIFNFWVKSLVSGIKSTYNLDKVQAKQTERAEKQEQRLSKREAKKLRRAERKKERG